MKKLKIPFIDIADSLEYNNFLKGGCLVDSKTLKSILKIGETVAVEFKRCGNGIESDTYESV